MNVVDSSFQWKAGVDNLIIDLGHEKGFAHGYTHTE